MIGGNKILLTGAGFSHNFGLPLARQVWGMIFNHPRIQEAKEIRRCMLKEMDYESLYTKVLTDPIFSQEKEFFLESMDQIFNDYIETLCVDAFKNDNGVASNISLLMLRNFIKRFIGKDRFLFTLNQDLFLERLFLKYGNGGEEMLYSPYMGSCIYDYFPNKHNKKQIGINYAHSEFKKFAGKSEACIMPNKKELLEKQKNYVLGSL